MKRMSLSFRMLSLPLYYKRSCLTFLLVCHVWHSTNVHAQAPITSSGLNTQISSPTTLPGGQVNYNITGGTRPSGGGNLFHSFGTFNVPSNNIANFLNVGSVDLSGNPLPAGLSTSNILGRVTGGNISNIFGTIQTTNFGNANLFLMNPAGVIFGPNAALNVGGMATFTTADYLRLAEVDGVSGVFRSNPQATSILTSAPLAAFGFLGSNPAAIAVQGSHLAVTEGAGISLVGGDITIQSATLTASGGVIQIASVGSAGEILSGNLQQVSNLNGQSFGNLGTIQISNQSVIDVSGSGGGTVVIRGGSFVIDESLISANITEPGTFTGGAESIGRGIDIQMSQNAVIQNGAVLETTVAGNATPGTQYGGTRIRANNIEVLGSQDFDNFPLTGIFSVVTPDSTGGNSGNIQLEAANSILVREFGTFTTFLESRTHGAGNAGNVALKAGGNLQLDGLVFVESISETGSAGNIELTSTQGNIIMTNAPFVNSTSGASSTGTVGSIVLNAPNGDVVMSGSPDLFSPAVVFTHIDGTGNNTGKGGIQVTAQNLTIDNSGIQIDNFTTSQPGNLDVNVINRFNMRGGDIVPSTLLTTSRSSARSAAINIRAQEIILTDGSSVATETYRSGDGGALSIFAGNIKITNGAQIRSGSIFAPFDPNPSTPSGAGGTITIRGLSNPTQTVLIDGQGSGILTNAEGIGAGGHISILANALTVQNGGAISAATTGTVASAIGGTITVNANNVTLATDGIMNASSTGPGNAGNITIQGLASPAQSVVIDGTGSGVFTETQDSGAGGNVLVYANSVTLENGGAISASTTGAGHGGSIDVIATESLLVKDAAIIASNSNSLSEDAGSAGTIRLNAPLISIESAIVSASTVGPGNAGDIKLEGTNINLGASEVGQLNEQGADIFTRTTGPGQAGNIAIHGMSGPGSRSNDVTITAFSRVLSESALGLSETQGNAGTISILTGQLTLSQNGKVSTASQSSTGDAGNIIINAVNQATIGSNSELSSETFDFSLGNGGSITVSAPTILVTNSGHISTNTDFIGNAGKIILNTDHLQLASGSQISSSSIVVDPSLPPTGAAGSVTVQGLSSPAQSILVDGAGSGIFTAAQGSGSAGNVNLSAQAVILQNGAQISSSSTGSGPAGNIQINANNQLSMSNSSITTEANRSSGGIIKITTDPSGTVQLSNSKISASVLDGTGGGGSIDIDPQFVILQNSQILAQAVQGAGGNIGITITNGGLFLPDATSVVSASSQFGQSGTVTIQAPIAPAGGKIQPLGKAPLQVTALLSQRCAAIARGEVSSFVVAGRDTLPIEPGGWLTSPLALAPNEARPSIEAGVPISVSLLDDSTIVSLRRLPWKVTQLDESDWFAGCTS